MESLTKQLQSKQLELDRSNEFFNVAIKASNLNDNSLKFFILNLVMSKEFKKKGTNLEFLKSFFGENFQVVDYLTDRLESFEFQNYSILSSLETSFALISEMIDLMFKMNKDISDAKNILNNTLQSRLINNEFIDFRNKLTSHSYDEKIEKIVNLNIDLKRNDIVSTNKAFLNFPAKTLEKEKYGEILCTLIENLEKLKGEFSSNRNIKNTNVKDEEGVLSTPKTSTLNDGKLFTRPIVNSRINKASNNINNNNNNLSIVKANNNLINPTGSLINVELNVLRKKYSQMKKILQEVFLKYKNLIEEDLVNEISILVNEKHINYLTFDRKELLAIIVAQSKLTENLMKKEQNT